MTTAPVVDPASVGALVGSRLDGTPLAVMLDVDGTLAPIAPTPREAAVPPETRAILHRLLGQPGVCVVLVSGRSANDAARVASVDGLWILGNHGMELRDPRGYVAPDPAVVPHETAVARAAGMLSTALSAFPGVVLENKRWTLSVHYRLADVGVAGAVGRVARDAAATCGLTVTQGRKVIELRPPVSVNKGTASVSVAERLGALAAHGSVLFAGDDRTDEDAMLALRKRKPDTVTFRVVSAEQDATTHAEFALASPVALRRVLGWLAERRAKSR